MGTSEMKTCGTCRHWVGYGDPEKGKVCLRVVDGSETFFTDKAIPANESAWTVDGEGYQSALITRADFGCVLWEPTAETDPPIPPSSPGAVDETEPPPAGQS